MIRSSRHLKEISRLLRYSQNLKNVVHSVVEDSSCPSLLQSSYPKFNLRQFSLLNKSTRPINLSAGSFLWDQHYPSNFPKPVFYTSTTESSNSPNQNQSQTFDSSLNNESKPDSEHSQELGEEQNSAEKEKGEEGKSEGKEGGEGEVGGEEKDILELLAMKEGELENREKEIKKLHDSLLRSYAEMENLRERTRREIESARKFAVQEFAKSLLDVADNLNRASTVTKSNLKNSNSNSNLNSNIQNSNENENGNENENIQNLNSNSNLNDVENSMGLLQSLLDGVDMTQKQLAQVFKKHGLVQYDPINENFDPNFHNALFEITDATKTPGTIAIVTKTGYTLNDRVIRPAEVGVVKVPDQ